MIIKHGNIDLNFNNIVMGKIYKNFREVCNVLDINYATFSSGRRRKLLLEKIGKYLCYDRGTNNPHNYMFTKYKVNGIEMKNELMNKFNRMTLGIEVLEYIKNNGNIDFINFIDSDYVQSDVYLSIMYYNSHSFKERVVRTVKRGLEVLDIDNYTIEDYQYAINNIIQINDSIPKISGLDNYAKISKISDLPETINVNRKSCDKQSYILSSDRENVNYEFTTKHAPKCNFPKENNRNHKKYDSNYNNNKTMDNLLTYCKYIENNFSKPYYIYKYTNKKSNMSYIGITKELQLRQKSRFYNPKSPFDLLIKNIGIDNFTFSILDYSDSKSGILQLENDYIRIYNSVNNGYNIQMNNL
jgi:hypothetical protein